MFYRGSRRVNLTDMYIGASVFAVGSGKSITPRHIEMLKTPGIVTASLNVGAHYIRPNIYAALDQPEVPMSIIQDPTVMKVFGKKFSNKVMYEDKDLVNEEGEPIVAGDYPNLFAADVRVQWFTRRGFLDKSYLFCQRREKGVTETTNSAIFLISLLYTLGFKTVYLVGFDFYGATTDDTYFFERPYFKGGPETSVKVAASLRQLLDVEDHIKIYNCNPRSGLDFFEQYDFTRAIYENGLFIEPDVYYMQSRQKDLHAKNDLMFNTVEWQRRQDIVNKKEAEKKDKELNKAKEYLENARKKNVPNDTGTDEVNPSGEQNDETLRGE